MPSNLHLYDTDFDSGGGFGRDYYHPGTGFFRIGIQNDLAGGGARVNFLDSWAGEMEISADRTDQLVGMIRDEETARALGKSVLILQNNGS